MISYGRQGYELQRISIVRNWGQYVLVGSTIRGYLSWLLDQGQLTVTFEDNRMLWQASAQYTE